MTNEDSTAQNQILLEYLQNIVIGSRITPSAIAFWIGNQGKYFVKGLIDDPLNSLNQDQFAFQRGYHGI